MITASKIFQDRSLKLWVLGALLLGLVVGLILAWRVWPTRWVDTDPSDLRAGHQQEYLVMVADSWTVTGDSNEARERLHELVDRDTDWAAVDAMIAGAIEQLEQEGDAASALRLSRMRETVPLPIEGAPAPVAPIAPVEPEAAAPQASPRWALVLIGLGLVVLTIALALWLINNSMRKREALAGAGASVAPRVEPHRPTPGRALSLDPVPGPGGLGIHVVERTERESPRWDDASFVVEGEESQEDASPYAWDEGDDQVEADEADEWVEGEEEQPLSQRPALAPEEPWHIEAHVADESEDEPEPTARVVDLALSDEDLELVEEVATVEPPAAAGEEGHLAVFEATYEFGDDDFYHAYTIESARHEFLGQCGIVISDVMGIDSAQLVDAFDIWLFETRGTRTVSKVVASEYAYTNDDLGAKLARKGDLVLAQSGLLTTLETESLRLSASITDVAYREDQPESGSVFARLSVRMVIDRIGA